MALSVTLNQFRAAVKDKIETDLPGIPLYEQVIDSVNEVPSIVLGFPEIELDQVARAGVLRLEQQVFVVGNRQTVTDSQVDLVQAAEDLFVAFGGGRNVRHQGVNLTVNYCRPRTLSIAGDPYNCYDVQVETESVNC